MAKFSRLTWPEVAATCADPDIVRVDVRDVNAYNGWPLGGETRGGHLAGARSLDAKWAGYLDWIEIVRAKGIQPAQRLVLYGYDPARIEAVAEHFASAGYAHVALYTDFLADCERVAQRELVRLQRYRTLVPASWLHAVVSGRTPAGEESRRTVIVHVHYRNRDAYLGGHVPGAIDLDTLALESPETWNRRNPAELKAALEAHGIDADTRVVLYGKYLHPDNADPFPGSAAGQLGAIRAAVIMMYAGVRDVRVLNGGFQAWLDAGYTIDTADVPKDPLPDFGAAIPQHPEFIVDLDDAKRILAARDAELVSVRSWPEFIGQTSGYHYIPRAGRIPGAVWGNCGSDAYHMENYRNLDHTVREADEVVGNWAAVGVVADKEIAFFCGTGWRGSEAFFNAYLMGWPRIAVYDGGWFEWSSDAANPIDTGVPAGYAPPFAP